MSPHRVPTPLRAIALLACLGAGLAACGPPARAGDAADALGAGGPPRTEPGPAAEPPPNVVLVTLDTTRADHLSAYGYERPTTPFLERLAASRATLWTRAYAAAPWTLPTHASLFTGRYPFEHGARTYPVAEHVRPSDYGNVKPLDWDHVTLAEALGGAGYRTAAFVANHGYLDRQSQLDQGFEIWHVDHVRAAELNEQVLPWLEQWGPRGPFFLFVNYMDAHRPLNTEPASPDLPTPVRDEAGDLFGELKVAVLSSDEPPPPELVSTVVDQYDNALAHLDRAVEAVVGKLDELGLSGSTLIVVTSDHGEFLGEHDLVEHSKDVYQEVLHVPLLTVAPGQREGRVDDRLVSSVHLPRLVVEHLPQELRERLEPLFPRAPGEPTLLGENYFARLHDLRNPVWGPRFERVRVALLHGRWKYVHSSDGRDELYDLEADPRELEDLIEREPALAERLREELRALWVDPGDAVEDGAGGAAELSAEERARLEELGYLGD